MRLRTLVLLAAVGLGGILVASSAEASPPPRGRLAYRTYRPAPRYYDYRSYRPFSYGYRYSYDPYYYDPYYYDPYYYAPRPVYRYYRPYYRPRVGISLRLGW